MCHTTCTSHMQHMEHTFRCAGGHVHGLAAVLATSQQSGAETETPHKDGSACRARPMPLLVCLTASKAHSLDLIVALRSFWFDWPCTSAQCWTAAVATAGSERRLHSRAKLPPRRGFQGMDLPFHTFAARPRLLVLSRTPLQKRAVAVPRSPQRPSQQPCRSAREEEARKPPARRPSACLSCGTSAASPRSAAWLPSPGMCWRGARRRSRCCTALARACRTGFHHVDQHGAHGKLASVTDATSLVGVRARAWRIAGTEHRCLLGSFRRKSLLRMPS